jgi:hypothetical protein
LLFNIFVEKIVMRRDKSTECDESNHTTRCEFVFFNYPGREQQIDMFQTFGQYLLWLGLTTERPKQETVPLNQPYTENLNIRYVGAVNADKQSVQLLAPPGGSTSDVPPSAKPYKLCFAPRSQEASHLVDQNSRCGHPAGDESNVIRASGSASLGMTVTPPLIANLQRIARATAFPDENPDMLAGELHNFYDIHGRAKVSITVYMRHTEGIIYYLGELARRALNPDLEKLKRYIYITRVSPYDDSTYRETAYGNICFRPSPSCAAIFRLREGPAPEPGSFVAVNYNGQAYWISGDYNPVAPDLSSMSLDFVKQLLALNSSAKSLPQSSVVTAVGQ